MKVSIGQKAGRLGERGAGEELSEVRRARVDAGAPCEPFNV